MRVRLTVHVLVLLAVLWIGCEAAVASEGKGRRSGVDEVNVKDADAKLKALDEETQKLLARKVRLEVRHGDLSSDDGDSGEDAEEENEDEDVPVVQEVASPPKAEPLPKDQEYEAVKGVDVAPKDEAEAQEDGWKVDGEAATVSSNSGSDVAEEDELKVQEVKEEEESSDASGPDGRWSDADGDNQGEDSDAEPTPTPKPKRPKRTYTQVLNSLLRDETRVPVIVTEQHHEVLRFWLSAADRGLFRDPKTNETRKITVVHFDSHPDLALPEYFTPKRRASVFWWERKNKIQINSFILAGVWLGYVDRVVWVRPRWSHQFAHDYMEDQHLFMGEAPEVKPDRRGKMERKFRVTFEEDYFLDYSGPVGYWKHPQFREGYGYFKNGSHVVPFDLRVVPVDRLLEMKLPNDTQMVLDIDEDFFSTDNPSYHQMEDLMGHENAGIREELLTMFRRENMCFKQDITERAYEHQELALLLMKQVQKRWYRKSNSAFASKLKLLVQLMCNNRTKVFRFKAILQAIGNVQRVHDMMDILQPASVLPIEFPSHETILKMLRALHDFLAFQPVHPRLVTITRSVLDNFTPLKDWPFIESELLQTLAEVMPTHVEYDKRLQEADASNSLGQEGLKDLSGMHEASMLSQYAVQHHNYGDW